MRLIKIYPIAALFLALLCFASCNTDQLKFDNIETPNYQGSWSVVIGETEYTIDSLIASISDSIETESEASGQIVIIYRDTTIFDDPDEFLTIGDVSNPGSVSPGINIPNSPVAVDTTFVQDLEFEYQPDGGEELDSVYFAAGNAAIQVSSTFDSDADIVLQLYSITNYNTGDTLVFSGTVPANGSLNLNESLEFYKAYFNRGADNINRFSGQFRGTLRVDVGDNINASDAINYTLSFTGPEFKGIFGYFGETTVDLPSESITFDVFEDIEPGGLEFSDPEVVININNSFGIPMGLNLDQISSSNSQGTTVNLTGPITQEPQLVRAPTITQVGRIVSSEITIEKGSEANPKSNIDELFNISPNTFNFDVSGQSNYRNDGDPKDRNFLTDSSKVETIVEVRMPLDFKLEGFTINADFSVDSFSFEDADTLKLRIKSVNQMPVNGTADLHFMSSNGTDTLLTKTAVQVITSPEVPTVGKIEVPVEAIDFVVITNEELILIQEMAEIRMVINVDSWEAANGQFVKIYDDYKLTMKLSGIGNINYEL